MQVLENDCATYSRHQQASQERERLLREALNRLIRGYVSTLDAARDRILDFGGNCDPLDVMERGDPHLREARAALSQPQEPKP